MEYEGYESLYQELNKLEPSEVIWSNAESNSSEEWCPIHLHLTKIPKTPFSKPEAETLLKKHYKLKTINGIGFVKFDEKDVLRHTLVKSIIKAYKK